MTKIELGYLENEICNRNGCKGIIKEREIEGCSCHINPPCSACVEPKGFCETCGWEDEEAYEPPSTKKTNYNSKPWEPRKLDPTKIDWRASPHSNSSMIKEGVFPKGTTRAEVRELVKGTFGGEFESFTETTFRYIAYTD